ncbi:hypothetical protein D3C81_1790410 [compost metagenome]
MTKSMAFEVAYGPLVDVCKAHGISRTRAFQYARDGLLETFPMGNRTFVYVSSVHTLPERLGLARRRAETEAQ